MPALQARAHASDQLDQRAPGAGGSATTTLRALIQRLRNAPHAPTSRPAAAALVLGLAVAPALRIWHSHFIHRTAPTRP